MTGFKDPITFQNFSIDDSTCASGQAFPQIGNTHNTFLGALGRIGDIEALNQSTSGLNTLVQTAAAGGPRLERIINGGAGAVLGSVGLDTPLITSVNRINPSAVNSAVFSANEISDRIANDDFSFEDIPQYTRDFSNVIKIAGNIISPGQGPDQQKKRCLAQNYAQDLIFYGVKQNYRFIVEFEFDDNYIDSIGQLNHAFVIKQCNRPTIQFEYEDINHYNYRTRSIRRATFNPLSMTFYDDQQSFVLDFYNMYLKAMSPITNMTPQSTASLEQHTMDFETTTSAQDSSGAFQHQVHKNSSSIGPLAAGKNGALQGDRPTTDVLKSIRLYHIYTGGGTTDVYHVINPKILSMEMDELNMEGGSPGQATFEFGYDAVNIETLRLSTQGTSAVTGNSINIDKSHEGGPTYASIRGIDSDLLVLPNGTEAEVPESKGFFERVGDTVSGAVTGVTNFGKDVGNLLLPGDPFSNN